MQSTIVSDYFINEYFLLHKEYNQQVLVEEFLGKIPTIFDYKFKDNNLLFQSLTHKSFAHEVKVELDNNEKLEFLGDSVLQIVVSEALYKKFSMLDEGSLSKLRSAIVNEQTLADIARFYHLDKYILVGKGELKNKGYEKDSILSDTFEAILGAIYLDSSFDKAKSVLINLIEKYESKVKPVFDQRIILDFDAKSRLQEVVMAKYKTTPKYISKEITPNKYEITLMINDKSYGQLIHNSKKKAMQILAKQTLEQNKI